jgi:hypothetical protein
VVPASPVPCSPQASWCFYEAGCFAAIGEVKGRPVYCLHPVDVDAPSPLANLQTIKAAPGDLESWIRNDLCSILKCQQPNAALLAETTKQIEKLIKHKSPVRESVLKPYLWIDLPWPNGLPDWNNVDALPDIDFGSASVSIDGVSATLLGFATPPTKMRLLPFLRKISCNIDEAGDNEEFWIRKFYESLREAARGRLEFQEFAYFRHESGKIFRPIVISYAKDSSGTRCKLRVLFASAFVSPLTDNPTMVQRLADGVRLAVRTQLEVVHSFLGRMSRLHREKVLSRRRTDAIARRNPVGGRLIEALDAIWQEAVAHGVRPGASAPTLFEGPSQRDYEQLRSDALATWEDLKQKAAEEDQKRTGEYPESERLLAKLKKLNEAYLELALPRLKELLTPERESPGGHADDIPAPM